MNRRTPKVRSGDEKVDRWLATKALQHPEKHLSVTKVLLDESGVIAGYYTLATGQVDFGDLPAEAARRLPRRAPPAAVLAWLGVSADCQGQGLGRLRLAQALRDCYEAGANCEMENNYLPDSTFRASRHAPSATDTGRRANMTSVFALSPPPTIIK